MNTYLVQYSTGDSWVSFLMKSYSIFDVHEWTVNNVQSTGICITNLFQ